MTSKKDRLIMFALFSTKKTPRIDIGEGVPIEKVKDTRAEVRIALKKMKGGKSVGMDKISVEVWKSLGDAGVDIACDLVKKIYEQESIPSE